MPVSDSASTSRDPRVADVRRRLEAAHAASDAGGVPPPYSA